MFGVHRGVFPVLPEPCVDIQSRPAILADNLLSVLASLAVELSVSVQPRTVRCENSGPPEPLF
jgi:hypothetical protein